jgi:hypothetical protein
MQEVYLREELNEKGEKITVSSFDEEKEDSLEKFIEFIKTSVLNASYKGLAEHVTFVYPKQIINKYDSIYDFMVEVTQKLEEIFPDCDIDVQQRRRIKNSISIHITWFIDEPDQESPDF